MKKRDGGGETCVCDVWWWWWSVWAFLVGGMQW